MWYVYVVLCKDKKLYTGITNNLERRLKEHNSGHGGRFTRARRPVTLIYSESAKNRSKALKREARIKQLKRDQKLALI
ncbi:MAG: GIY-YIG nuclease family protein [Candidatus Omnitrophica bacterium]|nr:GIY-YIG nuclease family protein [Candidatus Omnitrophota bacterium]